MNLPYKPFYCPVCKAKDEYYGRLVFDTDKDEPTCPNHKTPLPLVNVPPVRRGRPR